MNQTAYEIPHCLPSGNGRLQPLLSGNNAQIVNLTHVLTRTRFNLSLRGAPAHPALVEGRSNLDEAEHTSTNRRSNGDGIATLRTQ